MVNKSNPSLSLCRSSWMCTMYSINLLEASRKKSIFGRRRLSPAE